MKLDDTFFNTEYAVNASLSRLFGYNEAKSGNQYATKGSIVVTGQHKVLRASKALANDLIGKSSRKHRLQQHGVKVVASSAASRAAAGSRSDLSVRKVKQRISSMILTYVKTVPQLRTMQFVTVTFPANTADDVAEKCFNSSMTAAKADGTICSYLRVSERQANGTVHYHMLVPHAVNVCRLNLLFKRTLHDYFSKGLLACNWSAIANYNGVDLAKDRYTRKVVNFASRERFKTLTSYITKYITKGNFDSFKRGWSCSRDWSNLVLSVKLTLAQVRQHWRSFVKGCKKIIRTDFGRLVFGDFTSCEIILTHLRTVNCQIIELFGSGLRFASWP
jgi:hypothetical protein